MNFDLLTANLAKTTSITENELQLLLSKIRSVKLRKKQFLLHENQVAQSVAFVLGGCLRSYTIDANGFEHILQFAPANWWITDMYCFVTGKEGLLNIDAVTETEALLLTRKHQLELFDELPQLERYFRQLTEKALVSTQRRLMDNLSLTALQRYTNFCHTYPTLINELPQKQIASYIGVTPEFLSKIKSEYLKGARP